MSEKWIVIDCHNQFTPSEVIPYTRGSSVDLTDLSSPRSGPFKTTLDIEGKLRAMEDAGIDMAVSHQATLNMMGLDACKAMNDGNARLVKEYPAKFVGLAHVPLDAGPETLNEVDRSIKGLGLNGIALEAISDRFTLGSEELMPLYEKINLLNVPIVVHPSNLRLGVVPGMVGKMVDIMQKAITVEMQNCRAAIDVMFGVLTRFPELKFMLPHHGGAFPLLQGRLMPKYVPEGWKRPEKYANAMLTPRIRKELGLDESFQKLFEKLYFDISGFQGWMPITEATLLTVEADRLCFGTDHGFEMLEAQDMKAYIDNIKKLNIPDEAKKNMLGGTALELFKINASV